MNAFSMKSLAVAVPLVASGLLAGCVSQDEYNSLQAKYNALNQQYAELQQQSAAQLASTQEHVSRLQSALLFSLQDDMLFRTGSWELSDDGQQQLAGLAQKFGAYQQDKVVVNGYTDNMPIGSNLRSKGVTTNDELSQKRAESVMNWLVQHGANANMISAKGWGEANPVASNDTSEGRSKNRRVEIAIDHGDGSVAGK